MAVEKGHVAATGVLYEVPGPGRAAGVEGAVQHPAGIFVDEEHLVAGVEDAGGHDAPWGNSDFAEGFARIHPAGGAEIDALLFTEHAGARTTINLEGLL